MGLKYSNQKHFHCFFVTTTFVDHRSFGDVVGMYEAESASIQFCLTKYAGRLAAYCLMPTHLHLLVFINGQCLGSFMRDFKKYIAQKASVDLGLSASHVWMSRFDRVAIESARQLQVKLDYIHNNPVKAGLADKEDYWYWSSAGDYFAGRQGPISIWKGWMD